MTCPFCNLKNQEVILKDDVCFCIVNIEPLKDGHLMVLPKRHITKLADLTKQEAVSILKILAYFEKILPKIYKEDTVIMLNPKKWRTQPHLHFHILPAKGGLRHYFPAYEKVPIRKRATNKELKIMAEKIRKKL